MITQSTALSAGTVSATYPVQAQPVVAEGHCRSASVLGVAIRSGAIPFLQSLHPGYLPAHRQHGHPVEGPACTVGSADGQGRGFLLGTELAARLVSVYVSLPAEVGSLLGGFVSLCTAIRFARDQVGTEGGTAGTASKQRQSRVNNLMNSTPNNDKNRAKKTQRKLPERTRQTANVPVRAGQPPKTVVVLGALSGLTAAGAASVSGGQSTPWIQVANAESLGKIGYDPDYPLEGNYHQVADIDGSQLPRSIGNTTHPFTGQYDGQCHTIENLRHCLVKNVQGEGRVGNLRLTGAHIQSKSAAGVAVCEISDRAMVSNIRAEHAYVATTEDDGHVGIGAGKVRYGTVADTTAVNCTVKSSGKYTYAGIGAGYVKGGTVNNTQAVTCTIDTSGKHAVAGIGAGVVIEGTVSNTEVVRCTVKTRGRDADAGIGTGYVEGGTIGNTKAVNCKVATSRRDADAGIGVGVVINGTVSNTMAINCTVATSWDNADAGVGAGAVINGTVGNTTAVNTTVAASKYYSDAGIGAGSNGKGIVGNTTAVNCMVETSGSNGDAGVGVGYVLHGTVGNTTAINCKVTTSGDQADTAIGAGSNENGIVNNTTAVNCMVETSGVNGDAGVGVGYVLHGTVGNTTAINSKVTTSGGDADAAIGAGFNKNGIVVNTTAVNCNVNTSGNISYAGVGAGYLYSGAVAETSAVKCTVITWGDGADAGIGVGHVAGDGIVGITTAVDCTVEAVGKGASANANGGRWNPGICNTSIVSTRFTNSIDVCTQPLDHLCEQSAYQLLPPNCQPVTPYFDGLGHIDIADKCSINLPAGMMTLPGTGAPLVATLSTGAITGIALGAAAFVLAGVAGVCIYRHYSYRSWPAVTDERHELESIETLPHSGNAGSATSV